MGPNQTASDPRGIGWTGERCVPWTSDIQVAYEHYLRYLFALEIAEGRRVLDLASGEGYGAALLASKADLVLGVDVDAASIAHAGEKYESPNLTFRCMDMLELSGLADGSFDVITCFEAIEHVQDHRALLDGVVRLLKPGGIFAVSTPDRLAYAHVQEHENPFHVHELSRDEFVTVLGPRFAHIQMWGENISVGSTLMPLDLGIGSGKLVAISRDESSWTNDPSFAPTYLVALCSDRPLPDLPAYFSLLDTGLELVRRALQDRDAIDQIEVDVLGELQRTQSRLSRQEHIADHLEARISALVEVNQGVHLALASAQHDLHAMASQRAALDLEMASLRLSRQYRLGAMFCRLVDTAFPMGSQRRHLLGWARDFVRPGNELDRIETPDEGVRVGVDAPEGATTPVFDFGPLPVLQSSDNPNVTIVIPVYNGWQMTLDCLWAIAGDIPALDFEVIVVDDASTDETADLLSRIAGIRVIRSEENAGFLVSANLGASSARGDFIAFVNNDVHVSPGWVNALFDVADSEGDVGIVGGKIVDREARLQEAGGILFRDGSAWHYGRGADPDDPSFNFPREIDYCSGACMLVRRSFWESAGGFDTRFAPAYYEDADLAFTARKLGYKVLFEPWSRVVHNEGSSYGTDSSPRKLELMQRNQERFREKWSVELQAHQVRDQEYVRSASWRSRAGHALVADFQTPTLDQDAGSLRMYELLKMLKELGYAVTFVPQNGVDNRRYTMALEELGIEVLHGRIDVPYLIKQLSIDLKVALLARPTVAWALIPPLREFAPDAYIIYDTVDLHFVRERRRAALEGTADALRKSEHFRELETWLANNCDATFAVSEIERELILQEAPNASVHVIPTIHRAQHPGTNFSNRKGLLFVGSFNHPPNRDAVEWLANQIVPRLRERLTDAPLYIVGSNPTEEVKSLSGAGVEVLGWVPDLKPLYAHSRVFVAPLRYGAGIRGKIGESAAYGLPVVSTTLGAEGQPLLNEESILIADSPDDFVSAVVRLYEDEHLWTEIARNARRAVALEQSPTVIRRRLGVILASLESRKLPSIEMPSEVPSALGDS